MNYYTSTIPLPLAEKLKEKGMPYIDIDCETYDSGTEYQRDEVWCNNTYAEVFDWLMELGIILYLVATYKHWFWRIETKKGKFQTEEFESWHEAANKAIEKALELIKED